MRIPLDYYRILGLPIQATAEQLRQAHRDRTLQLPRREYSEAAIIARKQLIDESYAVLSDPEQRQAYDATFLTKAYELEALPSNDLDNAGAIATDPTVDPHAPSIEIREPQLVGVLLLLLELGEYELVLKLGRPYLSSGNRRLNGMGGAVNGAPSDIILSDIVLTIAFACLELGREQWQQGQYENASESLQTGQELLLQEGLFPTIRGEMQSDLFKLRPYRILELLALPYERENERRRGVTLLQDMLDDRGGIDGNGDDQSGLSVDDFLRFIQQLRSYLTVGEQHGLFESEARRPSAVATYLAVYALLARGFAEGQPALIRRAKLMLVRLGSRQDIHLEQAICALLLGQTEEASRALELSQEYESIAFIREHSQGSPDLLPGLCLYAEQWLQTEVFPQFRDLADQRASLKDYFADEAVQSYLEELPNEPEPASQWTLGRSQFATNGSAASSQESGRRMAYGEESTRASSAPRSATSTAVLDTDVRAAASNGSAMPTAERVSNQSSDDRSNGGASMTTGGGRPGQPSSTLPSRRRGPGGTTAARSDQSPASRFSNRRRNGLRLDRLMFLVATGFVGLGVLILIGSRLTQAASGGSEPRQTSQEGLAPALVLVAQPPKPAQTAATGALDEQKAKEVLETWLAAKSLAFGQTHDTAKLAQILVDPALTLWQANAEEAKAANAYSEYVHTVKITAVTSTPETPDLAQVEAEVTESSKYYLDGQLDVERSADDNLNVRYTLVRQNNQWFIQDWVATPVKTEAQ